VYLLHGFLGCDNSTVLDAIGQNDAGWPPRAEHKAGTLHLLVGLGADSPERHGDGCANSHSVLGLLDNAGLALTEPDL